jgi:hypothetical protein
MGGMMTQHSIPPDEDTIAQPTPRVQIAGLVSDVRLLAESEWEYAKARLHYSGGIIRKAGIYVILAVLALSAAAIALILGVLLIIASYWGLWVATISVVLMFSIAAYLFAVTARKTARNLSFNEDNGDGR